MTLCEAVSLQYADFFRRWNTAGFFLRIQGVQWYSQMLQTWADSLGVRAGDSILEVGCGPGLLTDYLARQGALAVGIDRSEAMIRIAIKAAEEMGIAGVFESGDACALPYASQTFSHVIASSLINIVPSRADVLREMSRVADTGGTVSFLVPSDTMTPDGARAYARGRRLRGFSYIAMLLWAVRAPKMTLNQVEEAVQEVEGLQLGRISRYLDGMVTAVVCTKEA
jgi:ubiquinone/menaquinone biosynthesis C-methylase UbiE